MGARRARCAGGILTPILDLPHAAARAAVATGAPVFVLTNPVEFHGPHLSLHNDGVISAGLMHRIHQGFFADQPLLLGAVLEAGVDPVHGPGTIPTSYADFRRATQGIAAGLAALGCRRVIWMTFHGSPLHNVAIYEAIRRLHRAGVEAVAPFQEVIRAQLTLEPERYRAAVQHLSAADAQEALRRLRFDFHGGFFETSVAMAVAPATVGHAAELPPCPEVSPDRFLAHLARLARRLGRATLGSELDFAAMGVAWERQRNFPGYTSQPAWATAEAGEVFVSALLALWGPLLQPQRWPVQARPPLAWATWATAAPLR